MVTWRLHLASAPEAVHELLTTDDGRARFWAEETRAGAATIEFRFPEGTIWSGRVLENDPPRTFALDYFGSETRFTLESDGSGGTDLLLTTTDESCEVYAGWVSVLLALKAAADYGVDLRNHDPRRTWRDGYADN